MVVTIDWKWDVLFSNCLQYIVKDGKRDEEWEQVISYPSLSHDKVMIYRRAMLFSTKVTYTKMTKRNLTYYNFSLNLTKKKKDFVLLIN